MNKKKIIFFITVFLLLSSCIIVNAEPAYVGENICGEESVKKILRLVGVIIILAKILIPLILIVLGSIDLYKGVYGKSEKDLVSGVKSLALRILAGVFIFFVPSIINMAFDIIYESTGRVTNECITCVLDTSKC